MKARGFGEIMNQEWHAEIFRLYHRPSFWEGMARLFDFGGFLTHQHNYSTSEEEADFRAIESDWKFVGEDLREAIRQYKKRYTA